MSSASDKHLLSSDNVRLVEDDSGEPVVLGSGAFGVVLDGWIRDVANGWTPAAHKVQLDTPGVLDEMTLVVGLSHPNIVRTYGFYRDKRYFPPSGKVCDVVVIVMEKLNHRTLYHLLEDLKSPLSMERRQLIVCNIASAVAYLHTSGLVHGDLKPHNVLVSLDGRTFKVSDFGLIRRLTEGSLELTRAGRGLAGAGTVHFWGTPEYMAPE